VASTAFPLLAFRNDTMPVGAEPDEDALTVAERLSYIDPLDTIVVVVSAPPAGAVTVSPAALEQLPA
jgi:hypothetical protein